MSKVQFPLRMEKADKDRLDREAKKDGVSQAHILRQLWKKEMKRRGIH